MKVRSPSAQNFTKKLSQDLENWMANLPQSLKGLSLNYLAIPGSHDSFTADISSSSDLAPDAEPILQYLSCLGPLVKYFIANWSRTQSLTATKQLENGVRYFDLRLATKSGTDEFYFVHGLYSCEVCPVLEEIETFLESHHGEVVILDCQHFYAFTQDDHNRLMQLITATFKTKLMPYTEHMELLNLEYMTEQYSYQVVVIYRNDVVRFGQPMFWPSVTFPNPWFNTINHSDLINDLNQGLANRDPNIAYISQCVLTPDIWYILQSLFSTLEQKCAVDFTEERDKWIAQQSSGYKGLNIMIADFIELNDCSYVRNVIELNKDVLNHFVNAKKSHTVVEMPPVHNN